MRDIHLMRIWNGRFYDAVASKFIMYARILTGRSHHFHEILEFRDSLSGVISTLLVTAVDNSIVLVTILIATLENVRSNHVFVSWNAGDSRVIEMDLIFSSVAGASSCRPQYD